jgi:peptide/nickel transport system substrate-binding protein
MTGGLDGRNPDWENFNLRSGPGGVGGWHSGPLQTMNEPLIMFNVLTGEHENWLAESWEMSADFKEISMKLRRGIEWSDGKPFTSEDVEFTFNQARDFQAKLTHTAEIHLMKEAQAIDPLTVKFTLKDPSPSWWVTTLTSNHGIVEQIVPKHIFKDKDPLTFSFYDPAKGWPVATGPFKLESASPEQRVFVRRDDWWAVKQRFKSLPAMERVVYLPVRDVTTRTLMLINNELDSMSLIPVPTLLDAIRKNPKIITWSRHDPPYGYLDWCPIGLLINHESDHIMAKDRDIRWAVAYALDRRKLIERAELGAGMLAFHHITPYDWFKPFEEAHKPLYQKYTIDDKAHLDKTEEIMKGKGYTKDKEGFWVKDGKRIRINMPVAWLPEWAIQLAAMLRLAGFDADADQTPGLGAKFGMGEIPMTMGCKGPSGVKGMDPYYMHSLYTTATFRPVGQPPVNPWATARWRNAEFDALTEQMKVLRPDDPKTLELHVKAMDIWFREMPDIYFAQLIIRHLGNETYWKNWPTKDNNYGFLHPWQQEFLKTVVNVRPATR